MSRSHPDECYFRGHPTTVIDGKWCYADTHEVITDLDGDLPDNIRPCKKCGKKFPFGEPDPCIGFLPGVKFACCGHGNRSDAYVLFDNDVHLQGFKVTNYFEGKKKRKRKKK